MAALKYSYAIPYTIFFGCLPVHRAILRRCIFGISEMALANSYSALNWQQQNEKYSVKLKSDGLNDADLKRILYVITARDEGVSTTRSTKKFLSSTLLLTVC